MERVRVVMTDQEYTALVRLAEEEMRPVDGEVRFLLVAELKRRRLLEPEIEQQEGNAA